MLVKDRMTANPVAVTPGTAFPEAFRLLRERRIHHLPVVDEDGGLIGVVAQTDLMRASPSVTSPVNVFEASYLLANMHIQDVMSSPPITVHEEAPLEEAARVMVEKQISCLPVMREGKLVGIITETDIFETFVEILGGGEASLRITLRVRDARGELSRLAGIVASLGGNICSVARFYGEEPQHVYVMFRLEGVEEQDLIAALESEVEEIVHVCCAA